MPSACEPTDDAQTVTVHLNRFDPQDMSVVAPLLSRLDAAARLLSDRMFVDRDGRAVATCSAPIGRSGTCAICLASGVMRSSLCSNGGLSVPRTRRPNWTLLRFQGSGVA